MLKNMREQKGITLIALVVTIIVLIILAAVSINMVLGENGIIDNSKRAKFTSEFTAVEEQVRIYKMNKDAQEILDSITMEKTEKLPVSTKVEQSDIQDFKETLKIEIKGINENKDIYSLNLYYIDNNKISITNNRKYIIDIDSMQLYDVKGEKFGGKVHHTLKNVEYIEEDVIEDEPEIRIEGDIGWYAPNMDGFSKSSTYMIYYNISDDSDIKTIPVQEYIKNGKQSKIEENGKTYILDNYEDKIWANIKTTANDLECWWVWIPRYAYKANSSSQTMDIIFIDLENKPIGTRYTEEDLQNYIINPAFTTQETDGTLTELQGIWMSKYEPSATSNADRNVDSKVCYAPDMTGFDKEKTYIEFFDLKSNKFVGEKVLKDVDLNTINNDNKWYDYSNKVWANVKTAANGIECWWVWIPRYAYLLDNANQEMEVIFIDLNNKPIDKVKHGEELPEGYIVHPAFTTTEADESKELKGIWMSKYEPSAKSNADRNMDSPVCYAPDMTGFDKYQTYIEFFNKSINTFTGEILLNNADLNTVNNDNKWYDYSNKVWANVKTVANGLESWWVWIPRYAYLPNNANQEMEVIFIDLDNKPMDKQRHGEYLPEGYIVHPAFTPSGTDGNKELKGIWISKYEPTNTSDTVSTTVVPTPSDNSTLEYAGDTAGARHTHVGNGSGTKQVYVTSSTSWCSAYNGTTPCSNYGYRIYCSLCGVRLRHYWCAQHYNTFTKVFVDDDIE